MVDWKARAPQAKASDEVSVVVEELRAAGFCATRKQSLLFQNYLDLVRSWGSRVNLVSARDLPRLGRRHLLESLNVLLWPVGLSGGAVVDIGSGAGFPGIPLAIWQQDLRLVLVESVHRKAQFLAHVIKKLNMESRAQVVCDRAEILASQRVWRERHDLVTARGVGPLSRVVRWAAPLVRRGGLFIAFKGTRIEGEIGRAMPAMAAGDLTLVDAIGMRWGQGNLVILKKEAR